MMTKQATIEHLLKEKRNGTKDRGHAFASTNIALCKYWGKRNSELNLPFTSSLSVSLKQKGAHANIEKIDASQHDIVVNGHPLPPNASHTKRLASFLDHFRFNKASYRLALDFNIPVAAGLASSACAFASIVKALNDCHAWQLDKSSLSILARLGSGSACRSIHTGFVEWERGQREDGLDSMAKPFNEEWPELCVGLCIINTEKKAVGSREGMQRTVNTSDFYTAWTEKANCDLAQIKKSIAQKDFDAFGRIAESSAIAMHATMLTAWPPLLYSTPQTFELMQQIWALREQGLPLYFTQDAGPNLKLLFLESDLNTVKSAFKNTALDIVQPFK